MICSECGKVVRPVVAVDIDGTLGDYHSHFLAFLMNYLGHSRVPLHLERQYHGDEGFKEWALEVFSITEKEWHDIKLAYRQGAQKRTMPIYSWAQPMCELIRQAGAELWITTTRPYLRLDNIDPDTRAWLDSHGIVYDYILYDEDKYEKLAGLVEPQRVVAVVDDLEEKVAEAKRTFGPAVPIIRRTKYNSRYHYADLRHITSVVLTRIQEWKELHT